MILRHPCGLIKLYSGYFSLDPLFFTESKTFIRDNTDKPIYLIFWCSFSDLDRKYLILKGKDVWLKVNKSLLILNCNVFLSAIGPLITFYDPLSLTPFV